MVVVADIALAHQQAGKVLQRVLAVGGVDALLNLLFGHALNRGGNLFGQRGGMATVDGDDAEGFGGRICSWGGRRVCR